MNSTQRKNWEISRRERATLITCAIIMAAFALLVCIASGMSLVIYAAVHTALTFAVITTLIFGTRHRALVHMMVVMGVIGASTALLLVAAYLPYYTQHINYMNSLK